MATQYNLYSNEIPIGHVQARTFHVRHVHSFPRACLSMNNPSFGHIRACTPSHRACLSMYPLTSGMYGHVSRSHLECLGMYTPSFQAWLGMYPLPSGMFEPVPLLGMFGHVPLLGMFRHVFPQLSIKTCLNIKSFCNNLLFIAITQAGCKLKLCTVTKIDHRNVLLIAMTYPDSSGTFTQLPSTTSQSNPV